MHVPKKHTESATLQNAERQALRNADATRRIRHVNGTCCFDEALLVLSKLPAFQDMSMNEQCTHRDASKMAPCPLGLAMLIYGQHLVTPLAELIDENADLKDKS